MNVELRPSKLGFLEFESFIADAAHGLSAGFVV